MTPRKGKSHCEWDDGSDYWVIQKKRLILQGSQGGKGYQKVRIKLWKEQSDPRMRT